MLGIPLQVDICGFVNGKTGETIVQADNLLSKNGGAMAGTVTYTNAFSSVYKSDSGKRAWVLHHPDSDSLLLPLRLHPIVVCGTGLKELSLKVMALSRWQKTDVLI